MKTPMQELFNELGKAEPTLMNLHSSDGRRFVQKYHDFLIKEQTEKEEFAVKFTEWFTKNTGRFTDDILALREGKYIELYKNRDNGK